jgi:hypothetical protein
MDIHQLKQRIDASGKKLVTLGNEYIKVICGYQPSTNHRPVRFDCSGVGSIKMKSEGFSGGVLDSKNMLIRWATKRFSSQSTPTLLGNFGGCIFPFKFVENKERLHQYEKRKLSDHLISTTHL